MKTHIPYTEKTGQLPDFLVKYSFFTEDEGGRRLLPFQGYRSDFWYPHENQKPNQVFMIWPEFLDQKGNVIIDGDKPISRTGSAYMWILNDEMKAFHQNRVKVGKEGFFMEGNRKVASCQVIKIIGLKMEE